MYNRYIPQADGSFQRSRMQDHIPEKRPQPSEPPQAPVPPPEQFLPKTPPIPSVSPRQRPQRIQHSNKANAYKTSSSSSVSGFLKQLLPKDFDTSDLMIVLLLLLMSGDCAEDQNTALLTLVLYLFL